jgi:Flp pilus assembly protein TadB
VAQTKKKRKRKHRGTQGGSINQRSTGRPRNRDEARAQARRNAELKRSAAPTWQSAFNRSLIMSAILFVLMAFVVGQPIGASAALSIFMLALYTPAGYYLERFLYRRRVAKEHAARQAARAQATGRSPRP